MDKKHINPKSEKMVGKSEMTVGKSETTLGKSETTVGKSRTTVGKSGTTVGKSEMTVGKSGDIENIMTILDALYVSTLPYCSVFLSTHLFFSICEPDPTMLPRRCLQWPCKQCRSPRCLPTRHEWLRLLDLGLCAPSNHNNNFCQTSIAGRTLGNWDWGSLEAKNEKRPITRHLDRWPEVWMVRSPNGQMSGWSDVQMARRPDGLMFKWSDVQMVRWPEDQMVRCPNWSDVLMIRCLDGQMS